MAKFPVKVVASVGSGLLALAATYFPSDPAVQRIQTHEAVRYTAYLDPVNIVTICTGSTKNVKLGMVANKAECAARLKDDLETAANAVRKGVKVPVSQDQFDSLVSFTFNVGAPAFTASTMLKLINSGQCHAAALQFDRWVYAKGQRFNGLVTRRADERRWFENDCYLWK